MNKSWTQFLSERIEDEANNGPWWINDKVLLNQFCLANNIPAPIIFKQWTAPKDFDPIGLPERFVLKPNMMSSSAGVMVLERLDDGTYFDVMADSRLSVQEIIDKQAALLVRVKDKESYRLLAEELITDARLSHKIPLDYKVYCFYDKPVLVQQIDRNVAPTGTTFFDGQFNPLELAGRIESTWKYYQPVDPVAPSNADEMLAISVAITKAIETPFMRVDLYDSTRGSLVGEVTHAPGGPYYGVLYSFTDAYNIELGREWVDALGRIRADGKTPKF